MRDLFRMWFCCTLWEEQLNHKTDTSCSFLGRLFLCVIQPHPPNIFLIRTKIIFSFKLIRCQKIIFNFVGYKIFLFQICAVVLLALGIWMMNDCTFLDELLRNRLYMSTGYTTLISACFIVSLSVFGCLGINTVFNNMLLAKD